MTCMMLLIFLFIVFGQPIRRGLVDWGVALGQKGIFALFVGIPIVLLVAWVVTS